MTLVTDRATEREQMTIRSRLLSERVTQIAAAMMTLHVVFRAWATFGAYYHYDDFNFISRMLNEGLSLDVAGRQYSGHIMPAGMYLSWALQRLAPFNYNLTAATLLCLQVAAAAALFALLVRMFGLRAGILPPFALYLFCPITVPVAIWWAAGINQLPMQIALFMALFSHIKYLRTRARGAAVAAATWVLVGLTFYEKTLLVFGAIAIITFAYFATGSMRARLATAWREYRFALVLYAGLGLLYLLLYVKIGLTFSPQKATNDVLGEVATNMAVKAFLPTLVGGPLHWWELDQWSLPTPSDIVVALSFVAVAVFLRELAKTRRASLRALWLPAFFLLSNILLVVAGRASFVGSLISLDFRFQGELGAVTAIALACSTMPILGARDTVQPRTTSELLDHPPRVTLVVAFVIVLQLISSIQYVVHWQESAPAKAYVSRVLRELNAAHSAVPLVDASLPSTVMWGLSYPENTISHVFRQYSDKTSFVSAGTDSLFTVGPTGAIVPALIPPTRSARPGHVKGCGYRVASQARTIKLDGPVAYGGWWVRIGYISTGGSPITVTTGDIIRRTRVQPGLHALFVRGAGSFDSVTISGLQGGARLCTDDVTVGRPEPVVEDKP